MAENCVGIGLRFTSDHASSSGFKDNIVNEIVHNFLRSALQRKLFLSEVNNRDNNSGY